ncbi:MAG: SprT family zinc-dependent metalloprotease [Patescibacteria group bacterium]|nr:SprT family zinc-dependent metalloprotease [Patescibacteria group bacterium]
MAVKKFVLKDGLAIAVYKRHSSRSIRLSVTAKGEVKVSLPFWVPYKTGVAFAESRQAWIAAQRQAPIVLAEGQIIGKSHSLHFRVSIKATKPSSRLKAGQIIITHPLSLLYADKSVQALAEKAAIRALRHEAAVVLPPRLQQLATEHGFSYTAVSIKQLTGRWGSCDQHGRIALNLFLMQLPWELIDYVLLHELVHTKHMNHGEDFWAALEAVVPGAKKLRTAIRKHKPVVVS